MRRACQAVAIKSDPGTAAKANNIDGSPVSTPIWVALRFNSSWIIGMTGGTANIVSRRAMPTSQSRSSDVRKRVCEASPTKLFMKDAALSGRSRGDFSAHQVGKGIHAKIKFNSANAKCVCSAISSSLSPTRKLALRSIGHSLAACSSMPGRGFAALTMYRQRLDRSFGMMRAKIKCINMGPMRCKVLLHMCVEGLSPLLRRSSRAQCPIGW